MFRELPKNQEGAGGEEKKETRRRFLRDVAFGAVGGTMGVISQRQKDSWVKKKDAEQIEESWPEIINYFDTAQNNFEKKFGFLVELDFLGKLKGQKGNIDNIDWINSIIHAGELLNIVSNELKLDFLRDVGVKRWKVPMSYVPNTSGGDKILHSLMEAESANEEDRRKILELVGFEF